MLSMLEYGNNNNLHQKIHHVRFFGGRKASAFRFAIASLVCSGSVLWSCLSSSADCREST